jgi:hypothetical protein
MGACGAGLLIVAAFGSVDCFVGLRPPRNDVFCCFCVIAKRRRRCGDPLPEAADDLKSAGYPQEYADSGTLPPSEAGGNFSGNGHESGVWTRGLYNFRDVVSSSL